jgi:putative hydrolase of the HAD superfamily
MIKAVIFDLGNTLISQEDGSAFTYALEVLTHLKQHYKLALITNTQSPTNQDKILELLHKAQLEGFFEEIVVSTEVGINKPNPRIFKMTLEKLGVKPEEAVMIGNTISTDIFGGNRIGMQTVLFQQREQYHRSEWKTPDHQIQSLEELLELL